MASPSRTICLALFLGLPLVGCVADVSGVFASEEGDGSGGASSTSNGATSGKSGATTVGPGSTTTGGPGATTSVTTGDSTSTTVGATTGGSTGSGDPPGDTVDCGSQSCSIDQGGICCWTDVTDSGTCASGDGSCQNTTFGTTKTAIECQLPSQCDTGQICCAHRDFDGAPYDSTSCDDNCYLPDRYLCDPNAPDCPVYQDQGGNPLQSTCKASTLLPPGYFVCGF